MPVAGIGSRFVALLVDYLIWLIAIVALILLFNYIDPSLTHFSKIGEKWAGSHPYPHRLRTLLGLFHAL